MAGELLLLHAQQYLMSNFCGLNTSIKWKKETMSEMLSFAYLTFHFNDIENIQESLKLKNQNILSCRAKYCLLSNLNYFASAFYFCAHFLIWKKKKLLVNGNIMWKTINTLYLSLYIYRYNFLFSSDVIDIKLVILSQCIKCTKILRMNLFSKWRVCIIVLLCSVCHIFCFIWNTFIHF